MGKVTEIELVIGGKDRTLVFDMNTIAELEEHFDMAPIGVLRDLGDAMQRDPLSGKTFSTLRAFLWAGMHQRSPGLKIEAVGRTMTRDEFPSYLQACADGIMAVYGIDKAKIAEMVKKKEVAAFARQKQEAGETLTADELKAIEEDVDNDPLAQTTTQKSQPLASSESKPSEPV